MTLHSRLSFEGNFGSTPVGGPTAEDEQLYKDLQNEFRAWNLTETKTEHDQDVPRSTPRCI